MTEVDELMGGGSIRPDIFDGDGIPTSQGLDPQYEHLSPDPEQNMNETHAHDYEGDNDVEDDSDQSSSSDESSSSDDEKEYGGDDASNGSERDEQSSRRTESEPASVHSNLSNDMNTDLRENSDLTSEQYNDSDLVRSIQAVASGVPSKPPKPKASVLNVLSSSKKNLDTSFKTHDQSATGGNPGHHT